MGVRGRPIGDRRDRRRLLDHDVRVGAAEAEGADAAARRAVRRAATAAASRGITKPRAGEVDVGIQLAEVEEPGTASCCSDSTTLISPAMPAAASR